MCTRSVAVAAITAKMILSVHLEQPFDLELAGDFHDAWYLRLGHIHFAGVHVLEQCLHFETFNIRKQNAAVFHWYILQNRLKVWRIGGQNNAMCLELNMIVHINRTINVRFFVYQHLQYLH